jgi:hypothetical protein
MKAMLKSSLNKELLTVIVIKSTEEDQLNWKEDHEFYYKKNLYDIVRSVKIGSSTVYYCINDEQEETLFSELDEMIAKHHGDKAKCKDQKSDKEFNQIESILPGCSQMQIEISKFVCLLNYSGCELNTEGPPPRSEA